MGVGSTVENDDSTPGGTGTAESSSSERGDRRLPDREGSVAMLCWDEQMRLVDWGARWAEGLGWSAAELQGESGAQLFAEEDWPRIIDAADRVRESGRAVTIEVEQNARDARRSPLELELYERGLDGHRHVVGLGTVSGGTPPLQSSSDVSGGEQALRRAARDIAHEFNNLLATIIGACRVMRLEEGFSEVVLRDIDEIERAGHRATALTRSLTAIGHGSTVDLPDLQTGTPASPSRDDDDDDDDDARSGTDAERPATVLLVEDEVGARGVIERMLEMGGYRVLSAGSGQEALGICEAHSEAVDLLITDVMMPGMNGLALFRALRSRRGSLRVLFMSGYTDDSIDLNPHDEDGVAFLSKPFLMDALLDSVRKSLAGS